MKKAVITGATGAVGRALIGALGASCTEVLVLARPGSARNACLPRAAHVRVVEVDLTALSDVNTTAMPSAPFDVFFHLGWMGTYGAARADEALQARNVQAALGAAALAKRLGCRHFVGVGSQAEYGNVPLGVPITEALEPAPVTAYGCAKLEAMQQTRAACAARGIRHVWARLFSVYGEGDRPDSFIMQLLTALQKGTPFAMTAGEQQWDYLHAADAARALLLLAEYGRDGAVYNVAAGNSRPLRAFAECARDLLSPQTPLAVGALPYPAGQAMNLAADISALARDTGFVPEVDFAHGVAALADFLQHGGQ